MIKELKKDIKGILYFSLIVSFVILVVVAVITCLLLFIPVSLGLAACALLTLPIILFVLFLYYKVKGVFQFMQIKRKVK